MKSIIDITKTVNMESYVVVQGVTITLTIFLPIQLPANVPAKAAEGGAPMLDSVTDSGG